jgi:hypothetical protein
VAILRQCRRAIPAHGRLLLLEQVVPASPGPHPARLLDLHMLVMLGGRERTREQWRDLLDRGGFILDAVTLSERSGLLQAIPRPDGPPGEPDGRPRPTLDPPRPTLATGETR